MLNPLKIILSKIVIFVDSSISSIRLSALKAQSIYGAPKPFVVIDQLASPEPRHVSKPYETIDDKDAAQRFGTSNIKEYSFWAWRACGIACVSMILNSYNPITETLYALTREANRNNGYLHSDSQGNIDIGWKHQALADLLNRRGLCSQLSGILSIEGALCRIVKGALYIASIKSRLSKNGSHMVVVTGFSKKDKGFIINLVDPFLLDGKGGIKEVSLGEFKRYYLHKGILVWPKEKTKN